MRAEFSSAVHKHKVAPEGKGAGRDLGSLWVRMWSIASIDARPLLFAFSLCAGAAAYFLVPDEPRLALCGLAWIGAGDERAWGGSDPAMLHGRRANRGTVDGQSAIDGALVGLRRGVRARGR